MNRWGILLCVAFAGISPLHDASAQGQPSKQKDLLLSIDVGYNTAFREKSWVPITVDIVNEQKDFNGFIEVRCFDYSNIRQSPTYRLAAECPRNSRKRYMLYAYLDGTARVEAWLYERGRRAIDAPAYMQVRPIERNDLLVAVLDDDAFNYGFLYAAVQREGRVVRVSRFTLPTSDLDRLPDLAQAYEAFDGIVFGDIDPDRITQRHRTLITDYVERGGNLIVSTGTNAADYRNSWLAPLLGAQIGETVVLTESELAPVLPENARANIRPDRQAAVATLTPTEGVKSAGADRTLATRYTRGRGNIYTVAIDATSHALQDVPGYHALWRDMLSKKTVEKPLNLDQFARTVVQVLPTLSGVKIRPLGWVMTYLLLYLVIGIVANWFFWNALKRREMAWFCLIGISFGFTAFAVLFGRSGNLRDARHQTVGVVQVAPGEPQAEVYSLTGILSSRTRSYSGTLAGESAAVRDAATRSTDQFDPYMQSQVRNSRPFAWDQTDPGRVDGLRVGASELRMMLVQGRVPVPGAIEGTLEIDRDAMRGTLRNATGYEFTQAALVYQGMLFPLSVQAGNIDVWLNAAKMDNIRREQNDFDPQQFQYIGYYGGRMNESSLRDYAQRALFVDDTFQIDYQHPPYIVAWSSTVPATGFVPDQEMTQTSIQTLVVSRINVNDTRTASVTKHSPLSVDFGNGWTRSQGGPPVYGDRRHEEYVTTYSPKPVRVRLTEMMSDAGEVAIDVFWQAAEPGRRVILLPKPAAQRADANDFKWHQEHAAPDENGQWGAMTRRTKYTITDISKYRDPNNNYELQFSIVEWQDKETPAPSNQRVAPIREWLEASLSARYVARTTPTSDEGVWPKWQ